VCYYFIISNVFSQVNIRGNTCSDCNTAWWQASGQALHVDSGGDHCSTMEQIGSGAASSEDNFGYYGAGNLANTNSNFACTASSSSTTQYWFGARSSTAPTSDKRSCKAWSDAGTTSDGEYLIDVDGNGPMVPFKVYCSFGYAGKAWTLVSSWRRDRNYIFDDHTFSDNIAINQDTPAKRSDVYRLAFDRMSMLRAESSTWFSACNMNANPTTDSVRAAISSLDILSFTGGGVCRQMEYVNIRGNTCSDCNTAWWQASGQALHVDSGGDHCSTMPNIGSGAASSEDNFGYYGAGNLANTNSNFACTATSSATTQYWFGM
jgi:hypothetical protein